TGAVLAAQVWQVLLHLRHGGTPRHISKALRFIPGLTHRGTEAQQQHDARGFHYALLLFVGLHVLKSPTSPAAPPGASVFRTDQPCVSRAPLLITCLMSTLANRGMPCVGKGFAVKRARLAPKVGLFGLAFSLWAAGLVLARPWPAATTGFVAQP